MILLTDTNDKVQLVTSAAATVDVYVAYVDHASGTVTPGKQATAITTATTTDVLAAPGASTQRNLKFMTARNKHATVSCDVTVVLDDNGTDYELHKETLRPGECLEYVEGVGFFVLQSETALLRVQKLGSDQSNSTTTPTEVTGLSMTTGLGAFHFRYVLLTQSAATTTGQRFSVNHTGTVTSFVYWWYGVDTTATAATAAMDQDAVGAAGQVFSAFAARAKSTAGAGTTISVDTANADMQVMIEGLAIVTVDGDLELWHGSEVAAASTVKAGSSLILTRTGD